MTKRVYKWFIDFMDGQQKWLNSMAAQGWRLQSCGILAYGFEACKPGAYTYTIEFVAHKTDAESKAYRAYLEGMGYRCLTKNINLNRSVGKLRWRPFIRGKASIATNPGAYNKELLIVEKPAGSEALELHTSAGEHYEIARLLRRMNLAALLQNALLLGLCVWGIAVTIQAGAFAAAIVVLVAAVLVLCLAAMFAKIWRRYDKRVKQLEAEGRVYE